MIAAIELLVALFVILGGIILYRCLIRSPRFTRFVGGVVEVPPTTGEEVLTNLTSAERSAKQRARELEKEATYDKQVAGRLRRRIG